MKSIFVLLNSIYNNKKSLLISLFCLSLIASSIFLIFFRFVGPWQHDEPGTDYRSFYRPAAENILQGQGFWPEGMPPKYPPGFPLILAAIFSLAKLLSVGELGLIMIFNILFAAGSTIFLFLISELIFNRKIALIGSLLWLSYPLWLWFLKNPNTEVPFALLLYAAFWFYLRAVLEKRPVIMLVSGLLFGAASLVRPISFLLAFILALLVFYLLKDKSKKLCLVLGLFLIIGNIAAILPWEVYVFAQTGKVIPLSVNGPLSIVDGLTFAVKQGDGGDQAVVPRDVSNLMKRAKEGGLMTWGQVFQFMGQEFLGQPLTFLKLMGLKLIRSWYATSQMWWEDKILLVQLLYILTGLAGVGLAIKNFREKFRMLVFLLVVVFYFWAMTLAVLSILRYMVPAMGLVVIFSAVALDSLWKKLSRS